MMQLQMKIAILAILTLVVFTCSSVDGQLQRFNQNGPRYTDGFTQRVSKDRQSSRRQNNAPNKPIQIDNVLNGQQGTSTNFRGTSKANIPGQKNVLVPVNADPRFGGIPVNGSVTSGVFVPGQPTGPFFGQGRGVQSGNIANGSNQTGLPRNAGTVRPSNATTSTTLQSIQQTNVLPEKIKNPFFVPSK